MKKILPFVTLILSYLITVSPVFAISTFTRYPQNPILQSIGLNPVIINKDGQYKMWYNVNYGQGWRINYAYSENGINNWTIPYQQIIPVGSPDGFEKDMADFYVLFNTSLNEYQMWYSAISQNWQSGPDRFRLGYATSIDGINWTKSADWALKGTLGSWDSGGMARGVSGHW